MTTFDYSTLLALAEAESFGPAYLARNGKSRLPAVLAKQTPRNNRNPAWSPADREYLRAQIGQMTDEQIAAQLGRTADAIKIKRTRWGFPAHSRRPGWLSGNQAAAALGVDVHNIMSLTRRGLLPHQRIPGQRGIINIRKVTLYRWAVNPKNWNYFNPANVKDQHLARLIKRQQSRWTDAWWTVGQTAAYHGCSEGAINKAIDQGRLKATRWGNHYILRSQAQSLKIYPGKGHGHEINWSTRQDAFIVLSTACGLAAGWIAARTGRLSQQTVYYRLRRLHDLNQLPALIQSQNLSVAYNPAIPLLFADWRAHAHRFPALAAAVQNYNTGQPITDYQVYLLRNLLAHWITWYGIETPVKVNASYSAPVKTRRLAAMQAAIIAHTGINPLEVL
jgi:hypothetical protein